MDCAHQVRCAPMGGVVGLDFGAILALAQARGADTALIAEVLPGVEGFITYAWSPPPS
ncbi:DUF7697 family protein [Caulobacter vibrioides]|uniref:DUF7697 family protein n=1 Tax=Caulobacter vibrioides TaxID=155892 RepID=UPI003C6C0A6A